MTSGVSRSGSRVMNTTCRKPASRPISFLICAARAKVVGQTAGHWVKPKKIIGIEP
ncbi:hypothetical protein D3C75_1207950 [compost metagenome]